MNYIEKETRKGSCKHKETEKLAAYNRKGLKKKQSCPWEYMSIKSVKRERYLDVSTAMKTLKIEKSGMW
jgi:hypothetical protein